jgi:hypothetical protein
MELIGQTRRQALTSSDADVPCYALQEQTHELWSPDSRKLRQLEI